MSVKLSNGFCLKIIFRARCPFCFLLCSCVLETCRLRNLAASLACPWCGWQAAEQCAGRSTTGLLLGRLPACLHPALARPTSATGARSSALTNTTTSNQPNQYPVMPILILGSSSAHLLAWILILLLLLEPAAAQPVEEMLPHSPPPQLASTTTVWSTLDDLPKTAYIVTQHDNAKVAHPFLTCICSCQRKRVTLVCPTATIINLP